MAKRKKKTGGGDDSGSTGGGANSSGNAGLGLSEQYKATPHQLRQLHQLQRQSASAVRDINNVSVAFMTSMMTLSLALFLFSKYNPVMESASDSWLEHFREKGQQDTQEFAAKVRAAADAFDDEMQAHPMFNKLFEGYRGTVVCAEEQQRDHCLIRALSAMDEMPQLADMKPVVRALLDELSQKLVALMRELYFVGDAAELAQTYRETQSLAELYAMVVMLGGRTIHELLENIKDRLPRVAERIAQSSHGIQMAYMGTIVSMFLLLPVKYLVLRPVANRLFPSGLGQQRLPHYSAEEIALFNQLEAQDALTTLRQHHERLHRVAQRYHRTSQSFTLLIFTIAFALYYSEEKELFLYSLSLLIGGSTYLGEIISGAVNLYYWMMLSRHLQAKNQQLELLLQGCNFDVELHEGDTLETSTIVIEVKSQSVASGIRKNQLTKIIKETMERFGDIVIDFNAKQGVIVIAADVFLKRNKLEAASQYLQNYLVRYSEVQKLQKQLEILVTSLTGKDKLALSIEYERDEQDLPTITAYFIVPEDMELAELEAAFPGLEVFREYIDVDSTEMLRISLSGYQSAEKEVRACRDWSQGLKRAYDQTKQPIKDPKVVADVATEVGRPEEQVSTAADSVSVFIASVAPSVDTPAVEVRAKKEKRRQQRQEVQQQAQTRVLRWQLDNGETVEFRESEASDVKRIRTGSTIPARHFCLFRVAEADFGSVEGAYKAHKKNVEEEPAFVKGKGKGKGKSKQGLALAKIGLIPNLSGSRVRTSVKSRIKAEGGAGETRCLGYSVHADATAGSDDSRNVLHVFCRVTRKTHS